MSQVSEYVFPTSFAQRRLWFLHSMQPESSTYNVLTVLQLDGPLDLAALVRAFDAILERHEILRTVFRLEGGEPVQIVSESPHPMSRMQVVDLSDRPPEQAEALAHDLAEMEAERPFDLANGPLVRGRVVRLAAEKHLLLLEMHHIVTDGWSRGILYRELSAQYEAQLDGTSAKLPPPELQYGDYAIWQRSWLSGDELERRLAYWREQLRPPLAPTDLPADRPRPAIQGANGSRLVVPIPEGTGSRFLELCRREETTLFTATFAAYSILLQRHTGHTDILVGTPIAGRQSGDVQELIGFLVNTLVLRTEIRPEEPFREYLGRAQRTVLDAFANQDVPFEKLVEELKPDRDLSRNPFFQTMLVVQHAAEGNLELRGVRVSNLPGSGRESTKFDLTLFLSEARGELRLTLEYSTDLFEADRIARLGARFVTLLDAIARDPGTPVGRLALLPESERRELLEEWNDAAAEFPSGQLAHQLIAQQVARTPAATAVSGGATSLTYAELEARSNQLAHWLRSLGAGPDTPVGVCLERTPDLVVALLGIWKAGAAYVPLDAGYPSERLGFVLEDSGATLVLTESALAGVLPAAPGTQMVCIDRETAAIARFPKAAPAEAGSPERLAYVIYTSGSTGKPKGVEIPHRALVNFLSSMRTKPGLGRNDVLLAVTTLSFDIAGLELYLPLITGARVAIATRDVAADPELLGAEIVGTGATVMQATPTTWRMLVDHGWTGAPGLTALCGGEALPVDLAAELLLRVKALWNLYGPTETTIWSTATRLAPGEPITLGRPIANTTLRVLDEGLSLCPVGVPGELCIGGAGLARGYHGRADLTAERFVPDPYAPGQRLYRTGDRVRYRPDGRLEYLGRQDGQVKIRGHRVEIGEVEAAIGNHPGVGACAATTWPSPDGSLRLVAYVVPAEPNDDLVRQLREDLRQRLPAYMLPSQVVLLDRLPTTPNGKVDRRALPPLDQAHRPAADRREAPGSELEASLQQVWMTLFPGQSVGVEDDFFDLGGHSLLAARMVHDVARATGHRLPLATFFEHTTIRQIADYLERRQAAETAPGSEPDRGLDPNTRSAEEASPRTTLEAVLLDILRTLLPGQPVGLRDGFVSLGGNPELAERVVRNLYEATGNQAPVGMLLANATVEEITEHVLRTGYTEQNPDIVPVQPRGSERPFFLLHGDLTGGGFYCRGLAQALGPDQPLYAIPPRTLHPTDSILTIDGMAAAHIATIRKVQTRGPYRLGGYCIGGLIAFEMAHQLRQAGESVEMLLLVDSSLPNGRLEWLRQPVRRFVEITQSDPVQRADRIAYLMGRLRTVEALPTLRAIRYFAGFVFRVVERRLRRVWRRLTRRDVAAGNAQTSLDELAYYHWRAKYTFDPSWYDGRIDLVQASPTGRAPREPTMGWGRLAREVVPQFPRTSHIQIVMTHLPAILRDAIGRVTGSNGKPSPPQEPEETVVPLPEPAAVAAAEEPVSSPAEAVTEVQEPAEYVFPASFAQARLWFLHQLAPDSEVYNIPVSWAFHGPLDAAALAGAWEDLLARHESLRTTFRLEKGEPVQVVSTGVHPASRLALAALGAPEGNDSASRIEALAELEFSAPFDLARGPLIRGRLIRVAENEHVLLGALHHIVADAWSMDVLYDELTALYTARRDGTANPLPEPGIQYPDFAVWQRDWLSGDTLKLKLAYWREQLRAPLPPLELATDRPRGPLQTFKGGQIVLTFPAADHARLLTLCHREGCTLFTGLLAAYAMLLHRHTGQDDVVIGTPTTGRPNADVERVIGFFVNTLPLRVQARPEESFRALVARSRRVVLDGLANPDVPFEKLVEVLNTDGDRSRNPLFQTMLSMQENSRTRFMLPGVRSERLALARRTTAKFDLTLTVVDSPPGEPLSATIEFNSDLFDERTVQSLADRFVILLSAALAEPDSPVGGLALLPDAERRHLLGDWEGTRCDYPADQTTHGLIARQAGETPQSVAVVQGGASLSYEALESQANQLAHRLRALGVGHETPVGICLERTPAMLVALLGVWKAGGAYVPIDPAHPQERIDFVLEDSAAPLVVTESALLGRLPAGRHRLLCLDSEAASLRALPRTAPPEHAAPESLAYVIYTSGSTGKPKGVEVPHRALVNLLWSMLGTPGLRRSDTLLAITTLSFDIAGLELFLPLLAGARVAIASRATAGDPRLLANEIAGSGATVMQATPTTWRMLVDSGWTGAPGLTALCGGEALPEELAERLLPLVRELWNLYGPTETTIWSTVSRVEPGGPIRLGRPIANTTLRILDAQSQLAPPGTAGELCVGGAGVARGYRGRPELTAERFIADPFEPGARLYRTGDRARWRADGTLEYLGRLDFQLKLRGHRIEPGEIESVLAAMPEVGSAVVVLREEPSGEADLVAFVVPAPAATLPSATELRRRLGTSLPAAMVPQRIVTLEALPLTPNGKIDRKALLAPDGPGGSGTAEVLDDDAIGREPRNTLEVLLREIWRRLLPGRPMSIHDDFFLLGGHSLLAAKMLSEVERATGVVIPIAKLFAGATIGQISDWIRSQASAVSPPIIEIQPAGSGDNFFMVHGDFSGGGFYCRGIAETLGQDVGVYAIPPYAPDGADSITTIEGMATHHLKAIRELQPHGPYRLGGYCIAGLVAYEIAVQLRAAGEAVDLLVLVDTNGGNTRLRAIAPVLRAVAGIMEPTDPANRRRRFGDLIRRFRSLLALPLWRQARLIAGYPVRALARAIRPKVVAPPEPPKSEALDRIVQHHWDAKFVYFPRAYDGRIDLLWSNEGPTLGEDPDRGWGDLSGDVVSVEAPSNHVRLVFDDLPGLVRDAFERLKNGAG